MKFARFGFSTLVGEISHDNSRSATTSRVLQIEQRFLSPIHVVHHTISTFGPPLVEGLICLLASARYSDLRAASPGSHVHVYRRFHPGTPRQLGLTGSNYMRYLDVYYVGSMEVRYVVVTEETSGQVSFDSKTFSFVVCGALLIAISLHAGAPH